MQMGISFDIGGPWTDIVEKVNTLLEASTSSSGTIIIVHVSWRQAKVVRALL